MRLSRLRTVARRGPAVLLRTGVVAVAATLVGVVPASAAHAEDYVKIDGSGSTWSQNALDAWIANVKQQGLSINYGAGGSSAGRTQFTQKVVDFAVSEVPYNVDPNDFPPAWAFSYMPIVAGGTSFMYNLSVAGKRVENLRLSGDLVAKIFTGVVTTWNDPSIAAENPGLSLPARKIVPVVRSDGSGTSAQFSLWLSKKYPDVWSAFCAKAGRDSCGQTSNFPTTEGFVAQAGSQQVTAYVKQNEGAINYVEYSYAKTSGFPVVKVRNTSGYYTLPTASNVAVGLEGATINSDEKSRDYLTQNLDGVYDNADPRAYPLSSYSYMLMPRELQGKFTLDKGRALGAFAYYFLCQGQQHADDLGYSPLPMNLVKAGFEQVARIPGVDSKDVNLTTCKNPTYDGESDRNLLAENAPQPSECDKEGIDCSSGSPQPALAPGQPAPAGGSADATAGGPGQPAPGDAAAGSTVAGRAAPPGAAQGREVKGPTETVKVTQVNAETGEVETVTVTRPRAGGAAASAAGAAQGDGAPSATQPQTRVNAETGEVEAVPFGSGAKASGGASAVAPGGAAPVEPGAPVSAGVALGARPVSVATAATQGWAIDDTFMVLTGFVLLAAIIAPPLVARAFTSRSGA